MKADRLLSIMLLLQTRGRVTAAELAERLEVSVRTVYRDIEALSSAGVPVWTERGRNGGIRLLAGYRTDVTGLTHDEARALFVLTADGTHDALGLGGAIDSALRKVMAALPAPHRADAERTSERILVDPARWRAAAASTAVELAELQQAVFADRRLELVYHHSGSTEPVGYTVDPYGLVSKAGVWYLVADRDGEPQLFRADRVRSAATSAEPVRRRRGQGLAEVWSDLREQVERSTEEVLVRCLVRSTRLDRFLRIQAANLLGRPERPTPGAAWAALDLGFPALPAVRALLVHGADVEVLDPPEARAELAAAAAEVAALYRG
ncbi:helix-turn-helix transcriptional regulator [Streptacidiphilus cavernicola]|uniref:Helix-turn-helix transcriptional regulator n=1 Tax=Streptacidiphilus cavernicola TaxID=3342716 RepID=A0ABV6VQ69_9ACTN